MKNSRLSGFYKLSVGERLKIVKEFAGLSEEETKLLQKTSSLDLEQADRMIENVIGIHPLPFGIAVNFLINKKDYLIPMAIEEPSIVAAASNVAKMARSKGGFKTSSTEPIMIGQIHLMDFENAEEAEKKVLGIKENLIKLANEQDPLLVEHGGGAKDIETKILQTEKGPTLRIHLLVDCRDAMGANAVNTMVETLAPVIEKEAGGKVYLHIISNLADKRLARAETVIDKEILGKEKAVDDIVKAYACAASDPYRAATHNKGIMNAIDAIAIATGNDFRALESGAHSYAALSGQYKPLTTWEKTKDGDLLGKIELPMAVGLVGGATKVHPIAKIAIKILGVKSASELGEIMAAAGLAQNLAAIRAISQEGIQEGHMKLHARNIAASVGAEGEIVDKIAEQLVKEKNIKMDRAKELLEEYSKA